jgi:glycosyltransferase involved in cell wall biosynthesis
MTTRERRGLVSVITPCYNAAPFVAETIASVAAQTYRPVEQVVVDDCSTDGSWDVVRGLGDRVRAVRVPENRGAAAARNRGFALASGDFIMFLDADDVLEPRALATLVAAARDGPAVVAVCRWSRLRRSPSGEWAVAPPDVPFPPSPDPLDGWLRGVWVPPCAVLWRRDAYEIAGGWDETLTFNDDAELMMRALARGVTLVTAGGGALSRYRAYGDERLSLSRNVFSEQPLRSGCRVVEKVAAELEARGRLAEYAEAIGLAYHRLALRGFQQGQLDFARQCRRRAERYAGRRAVSRTLVGRVLDRLVGTERKERLVSTLAQWGVATRERRSYARLRQRAVVPGQPAPDADRGASE